MIQRNRSAADCSHQKNQVSAKVIASDDVTSGLHSDARPSKDKSDATQQHEDTGTAPFDSCPSMAADAITADLPCDAVDGQPGSTTRTTASTWNAPATMKYGDHARKDDADIGSDCVDNRRDDGSDCDFRFETVAKNDSEFRGDDDESRSASRQHHDDVPHSSFTLDGPSSSSSTNFNAAAMANSVRSMAKSHIVQSASSSLYAVYAQSPGSRRREQQQRGRRQQIDQDAGRCSPSRRQFCRTDDADDRLRNDSDAASPQQASRHRHGAPGHQVSSSFENLVGGLLAVPQPQWKCHLANAAETPADCYTPLPVPDDYRSAESLCGRGADFLPVLTAFLATGTSMTATRGCSSSLPANLTAEPDPEPVLPRHAKHVPPHVRRAKHLFRSCVGRRSTPTHRPKDH